MHVAYAYEWSADDIEVRSGHPFFILDQLERRANVSRVFPLSSRHKYMFAPKYLFHRIAKRRYQPDREPRLLKSYAAQIERRLGRSGADCVFAPNSCVLSFLDVNLPKVFCADATFANLVDAYDDYRNCARDYVEKAHAQEAHALAACSAAIYPSHWAARSAIERYGADPGKVHVLPFGANVDVPPHHAVTTAIEKRTLDLLRVLFMGREWKRKGADVVVDACSIARQRGLRLTLDIVGIDSVPMTLPDFARNHGVLRKTDEEQRRRIASLLSQSHLLFVPSRAEAYGMVFCEAAAYGVPSLASDVGGIPTIVRDNVSGFALPVESPAEAYANAIMDCASDQGRYMELARSARIFYDEHLSWDLFGEKLVSILQHASVQHASDQHASDQHASRDWQPLAAG